MRDANDAHDRMKGVMRMLGAGAYSHVRTRSRVHRHMWMYVNDLYLVEFDQSLPGTRICLAFEGFPSFGLLIF